MNGYISPDGKYLAYGDKGGIHIQLIDGGETRTIPQPKGLGYKISGWFPIGWFADGTRLLAQATSPGAEHSSVWVTSVLGKALGAIREGALAWSVSPDGSLIALSSTVFNSDIWLMGANGEGPHKIVTAEQGEFFVGVVWSPDNRRIAYGRRLEPAGTVCDIASRELKTGQAAVILSDPKLAAGFGEGFWWLADGRLSADGAWIVYASLAKPDDVGPGAPSQLSRLPVSGGASQLVLTANGYAGHRCARAPAISCLLGEQTGDQRQLIFTAFDPINGRGREVMRVATKPGFGYNWDLSPDGSQLAISFAAGENRIRLFALAGGPPHDLVVNGWYSFNSGPDWAADSKGFYVSSLSPRGATLLYIDLNGHANALWEQRAGLRTSALPSPDGRHLAILGYTMDSNIWMLENF